MENAGEKFCLARERSALFNNSIPLMAMWGTEGGGESALSYPETAFSPEEISATVSGPPEWRDGRQKSQKNNRLDTPSQHAIVPFSEVVLYCWSASPQPQRVGGLNSLPCGRLILFTYLSHSQRRLVSTSPLTRSF